MRVSVITAVRNGERTLEQTILSVLHQTFANVEYIIVDGASTDGTLDLIAKYDYQIKSGDFPNISFCYISEPDKGVYDAWNKALKLATGEWICFLGSDDLLLPNAISNYMELITANPNSNFVSSKVEYVDEHLNKLCVIGEKWSNKMKRYATIAHVGSMHKKELFEKF